MASSGHDIDRSMTMRALIREPTGYLPVAMSVGALAMIVWFVLVHGVVRQPDDRGPTNEW